MVLPPTANWYSAGPAATFGHVSIDYACGNLENTGPIANGYYGKHLTDITDGTSNTILASEKRLDLLNLGQYQSDDNEGYSAGWGHDTIRQTTIQPEPDSRNGGYGEQRFGSSHTNVFLTLYADGSVNSPSFTIDLTVFSALGTINGNEVVALP